jgi:signal transduction histidine kinase
MKTRRITILRKGLLVLALPLIYQALFIGLLMKRQSDHHEAQRLAVHTKDVLTQTDYVYRLLLTSQNNLRAYVLTEDPTFAAQVVTADEVIDQALAQLKILVQDSREQSERFQSILARVIAWRNYKHSMYELARIGRWDELRDSIRSLHGQPLMTALSEEIRTFRETEEGKDSERLEALAKSSRFQNWLLVGGLIVNVGIGALAAAMFSREISGRIKVVTANTRRIVEGEALPPLVAGSDEIRELDEQFHLLADHLKTARLKERVYHEALERRASELTRANSDLAQKNQEIEMFVYSVSHDLRSPLVNLQGFSRELGFARAELETMLRRELPPAERERARVLVERDITESVQYIQTAVTRLSSIIDALLRLSRAGSVEYQPTTVQVGPIIHRIVEAMRGTILERRAEVTVLELPSVWADPTALDQIFANLIGNAVNYLDPKRPGKIEVGSVAREVDGIEKALTYYVKDNGLGIAEAYLPKVFAIFQRLHGNVAVGEGVGLALVRRVVERHGGKVWVESIEGEGSTFFVAFPADSQLSPLPGVAPRKERIKIDAPNHDHESSHHPAR